MGHTVNKEVVKVKINTDWEKRCKNSNTRPHYCCDTDTRTFWVCPFDKIAMFDMLYNSKVVNRCTERKYTHY